MEKLSGLVLDVYDDQDGSVLQSIFPSKEDLPDLVKTAHAITLEERGLLPDDAFALVLVDGDVEMKKFATIDAANTALSVEYFLKTGHKLPEGAQKVAAHNLCVACGWYDIEPPEELRKIALNLQKMKANLDKAPDRAAKFPLKTKEALSPLGLMTGALVVPAQASQAKRNLQATKGVQQIMTPDQIRQRGMQMGAG